MTAEKKVREPGICRIEGCDDPIESIMWGLCLRHDRARKMRKHYSPKLRRNHEVVELEPLPVEERMKRRRTVYRMCPTPGCKRLRPVSGADMCGNCAVDKHPDVVIDGVKWRFRKIEQGYRKLVRYSDSGKPILMLEHRAVMASMVGRPLLAHENVHHINGVRDDNRPSNLELWSTSQPCGQRVKDKVAWAKEMLALYEPGALSADLLAPNEEDEPADAAD